MKRHLTLHPNAARLNPATLSPTTSLTSPPTPSTHTTTTMAAPSRPSPAPMAEPSSLAASALQVAGAGLSLAETLHASLRAVKGAPKHLRAVAVEV